MCNVGRGQILSIQAAVAQGLLGKIDTARKFDETWVAPTSITIDSFREIRDRKDADQLTKLANNACFVKQTSAQLQAGHVYAAVSKSGKSCLFFVESVDNWSSRVEACHILVSPLTVR